MTNHIANIENATPRSKETVLKTMGPLAKRNITIFKGFVGGKTTAQLSKDFELREDYIRKQLIKNAARQAMFTCGLSYDDLPECYTNKYYRVHKDIYLLLAEKAIGAL